MRVLFLDFDGVLNSHQSAHFWHNKRDQSKWENEMYTAWQGFPKEYLAQEFCPIAMSNVEELVRRVPDLKIVVSSSWRLGETVESLKKILYPSKLIADAIIDVTPRFGGEARGHEIHDWLTKHVEVTKFVIVDDDEDMVHLSNRLVRTDNYHGFTFRDMIKAQEMLEES